MSVAFSLRPAAPEDTASLLRLIQALAEYERLAEKVQATEADLATALFGPTRRAGALIAEVAGEAVGFALWFYTFSTFTGRPGLYLEDIYVAPEHRGRGIGRAVFRHLARLAEAEGCARLEWSVLDWNRPALRFYATLGAEAMSDWTVQRISGPRLAQLAREKEAGPWQRRIST